MTLPTSGALTFSAIQTEFGGTNPITMSEYYGRTANIAASGQISMSQFYGQSALSSSMVDKFLYDMAIQPTNAYVAIDIYANGTYKTFEGGSSSGLSTWKGGGSGSDYDIQYLKTSGATPTGDAVNTWHNLATTRSWGISESTNGFASTSCGGRLLIRMNASPQTILSNTSLSMTAEVEV